jgi:Cyclopropane fatty acid synthase and related methyltransferases
MCFSAQFWNDRYQSQQTSWDLKSPSTPLKEYIDQIEDKSLSILIPGCGNAYEAEYLVEKGFTNITLIDISDVLVQSIQEKFKSHPHVNVILGDFFDLEGSFDLILEQTFFCALNPEVRPQYATKMNQLLSPNGKLVGVLFNRDFGNPFPPLGGSKEEYQHLFDPIFNIITLANCYNSIPPRAGTELFIQLKRKA